MTITQKVQCVQGLIGSQIPNLMTAAIVLNNNDIRGTIHNLEQVIIRLTEAKQVLEHLESRSNA